MSVLVIGTLMFWLFSVLIITLPAALVGLFAAVGGLVRPDVPLEAVGRFWRAFRRSFGAALGLGLLVLGAAVLLYLDITFFWSIDLWWGKAAALLSGSLAIVALLVSTYAWPLLAWYPQPLPAVLRRSFFLAAAHPVPAIAGLLGAVAGLMILATLPGPVLALLPALGPGVACTFVALGTWHAMKRYAGPEDDFAE